MPFTFSTRETVKSAICEGVTLTIRKMTGGSRIELQLALADSNAAMREVTKAQIEALAVTDEAVRRKKLLDIAEQSGKIIMEQQFPALVRFGLVAVDGLTVDGEDVHNVENFIKLAPEELYLEAVKAIKEEAGMNTEVAENLESPTTSGAQVDGQTAVTTAPSASAEEPTGDGTASFTSPNES